MYEEKNSEMAKILHRPIRALTYPEDSSLGVSKKIYRENPF